MDLRNTYIVSGLAFIEQLEPKFIVSECATKLLNLRAFSDIKRQSRMS